MKRAIILAVRERPTTPCFAGAGVAAILCTAALAFASAGVGNAAPALNVSEMDGKTFDLSTQRGRVVIINFWATWCPPCREEMPVLDAFYRRYHAQGVEMLGLSTDRPRDRSDVVKVMHSFSYPAAMLDNAKVNDFGSPAALPETFVVDRAGIIRAVLMSGKGPVTEKSLADVVVPLLSQKPQPKASPGSTAGSSESDSDDPEAEH